MAFDETTLQRQWKITVAICLAYGAVLSVIFGLILYDPTVAGRLVGLTQAQSEGWTITVITRAREIDWLRGNLPFLTRLEVPPTLLARADEVIE